MVKMKMIYPVSMKEDPLGFVFTYHYLLNNHRLSMYVILGSITIAFSFTTLGSYYLWLDNGIKFLKQHSVNMFLSPWIIATIFTEMVMIAPRMKFIYVPEKMWDVDTVSDASRARVQKNIKIQRFVSATYLFQCLATGFLCPLIGQICGSSIHADIHYVDDYFSGTKFTKFLLCGVLYCCHQILAFHSISSYMMMKYGVQSVIIQLDILSDYLDQAKLYTRKEYLCVRKHLKICAAHHIFLLRIFKEAQDLCYTPFVYLLFCGQAVLLCCAIFLYYNRQPIYILQIGALLFLSYVLAMDCCQDGQSAEDALEEFRLNLVNLKWYDWDEISKKMLLIMLTRTQRTETLNTLGISIDRSLMVLILKLAYQAIIIFLRFT